jgi:crotonobetainyl-CoA:carnitine CoA-transferase CaiB-like acyl-CoA transferase
MADERAELCGRILADLGVDVIKLDSNAAPDFIRVGRPEQRCR